MDQLNPRDNEKIYEAYLNAISEETYKEFFTKMLKKYGVDEPDKLPDDKKKQFYDEVDKKWKGKKEKPEANESFKSAKQELMESAGGRLHGIFGDLFDYLENNFFGMSAEKASKVNTKKLTTATEKLYNLWKKELKGGLIGW